MAQELLFLQDRGLRPQLWGQRWRWFALQVFEGSRRLFVHNLSPMRLDVQFSIVHRNIAYAYPRTSESFGRVPGISSFSSQGTNELWCYVRLSQAYLGQPTVYSGC